MFGLRASASIFTDDDTLCTMMSTRDVKQEIYQLASSGTDIIARRGGPEYVCRTGRKERERAKKRRRDKKGHVI